MSIKITRNLLRQYYGIGSTPTYYLCTPFTKLNEENNPEKDDSAFINDVNSSPSIIGYKNGFTFEAQVHEGDEVVDDLVTISREQKTGTYAERYILDVDMNKEGQCNIRQLLRPQVQGGCGMHAARRRPEVHHQDDGHDAPDRGREPGAVRRGDQDLERHPPTPRLPNRHTGMMPAYQQGYGWFRALFLTHHIKEFAYERNHPAA